RSEHRIVPLGTYLGKSAWDADGRWLFTAGRSVLGQPEPDWHAPQGATPPVGKWHHEMGPFTFWEARGPHGVIRIQWAQLWVVAHPAPAFQAGEVIRRLSFLPGGRQVACNGILCAVHSGRDRWFVRPTGQESPGGWLAADKQGRVWAATVPGRREIKAWSDDYRPG